MLSVGDYIFQYPLQKSQAPQCQTLVYLANIWDPRKLVKRLDSIQLIITCLVVMQLTLYNCTKALSNWWVHGIFATMGLIRQAAWDIFGFGRYSSTSWQKHAVPRSW